MRKNISERFWSKVNKNGPLWNGTHCWVWIAGKSEEYGCFGISSGVSIRAHRWAYTAMIGEIPKGLTLDHLCRNPICVRPQHLDPVTWQENIRRGIRRWGRNATGTHCINGHEFTQDNTKLQNGTYRICRACEQEYMRGYYIQTLKARREQVEAKA